MMRMKRTMMKEMRMMKMMGESKRMKTCRMRRKIKIMQRMILFKLRIHHQQRREREEGSQIKRINEVRESQVEKCN